MKFFLASLQATFLRTYPLFLSKNRRAKILSFFYYQQAFLKLYFIYLTKNVKPFAIPDFGGANIEPITNPARDFLNLFENYYPIP